MAKSLFDKAEVTVTCPDCGHEHRKSLGWLRSNDAMVCAGCGQAITLKSEKLRAGLDSADKTIANFKRNIARLNKRK